jgi:hypothetical protein
VQPQSRSRSKEQSLLARAATRKCVGRSKADMKAQRAPKLCPFENVAPNEIQTIIFDLITRISNARLNHVCIWPLHDTHQISAPSSLKPPSYSLIKAALVWIE